MIRLYKVLSFVLQPVGFLILMMSFSTLLAGMGTPQLLFAGAVGICIFLYTFSCFRFVMKAVIANQPVKASLKDWIKVNSYVCLLQGVFILFSVAFILSSPSAFNQTLKITYDSLTQQAGGDIDMLSFSKFVQSMKVMVGIMGVFELILVIHIFLSWRMLKGYREYFSE